MSKEDLYNKYELNLQKMEKEDSKINRPIKKRLYASYRNTLYLYLLEIILNKKQ